MTTENIIVFLEGKKNEGDVHASNILGKLTSLKNNETQKKIIKTHCENYIKYRQSFDASTTNKEKTNLYNDFRRLSFNLNRDTNGKEIFSFQSKYLSTIMEEFFKLLLKPLADKYGMRCGSIKAYNQLSIQSLNSDTPQFTISEKDQDIAIYKTIELKIGEISHKISVPALSMECKTWLDKTMLEGSASTAIRIKQGVTNAKFFIITDTYGVGKSVPKPKEIDKIFVTKQRIHDDNDNNFDCAFSVVEEIYNEVKNHLETISVSTEQLTNEAIKKGIIT